MHTASELLFKKSAHLRSYKIRGTATAPTVLITKDLSVYIHIEKPIHGDGPWSFGPGEIFGFNVGSMIQDDAEVLKGRLPTNTD